MSVSHRHLLFLLLITTLNVFVHFTELPLTTSIVCSFLLAWRFFIHFTGAKLPPRILLWAFSFVSGFLTWTTYRSFAGQEPATHLLVLLIALKLLETVKYRDVVVSLFLSYLLLGSKLLTSQSFSMTLFLFFDVALITSLLFRLHHSGEIHFSLRKMVRPVLRMLLQSSPLILFLFFVFPRFTTGFFSLGPQYQGQTGFDDELNPGDMSEVILSGQLAFRAEFEGEAPPPDGLYWRAATLWNVDGMSWNRKAPYPAQQEVSKLSRKMRKTEVSLEPRFGRWLIGLDVPHAIEFSDLKKQVQVRSRPGQTFQSRKKLSQRVRYKVESRPASSFEQLNSRDLYLRTSEKLPQELRVLVDQISSENKTERDKAFAILRYFRRNDFRYTLAPGVLSAENRLADFMLNKKVGFCEHYASAFSLLMRHMGVPARVVIGFQGGQYNEVDNYYIVTDSDAHAWSEYWSGDRWVRIDPTASIAPLRISLGGQEFYNLDFESLPFDLSPEEARQMAGGLSRAFQKAYFYVDALTNRWNLFLLRYDLAYQKDLLKKIGFNQHGFRWLWLFTLIGLGIGVFFFFRSRPTREDPIARDYERLCLLLEKKGLPRAINEGPWSYSSRAIEAFPTKKKELTEIFNNYVSLRYSDSGSVDDLRKKVREFRF